MGKRGLRGVPGHPQIIRSPLENNVPLAQDAIQRAFITRL